MSDLRPFHDHGGLVCSKEKHAAIVAGINPWANDRGKVKAETPEQQAQTMWRYALEYTRCADDGVRCACCGTLLVRYEDGVNCS